jgi:hypothetical protein
MSNDMENNGLAYTFTREEVEAVASVLKFARENGNDRLRNMAKLVASAFNRPFLEGKFIEKQCD